MRCLALVLMCLAAPAAAQDYVAFQSPSGNIHCMISVGGWSGARCDIFERTPSFRRPADCDLDWGHAFEVGPTGSGYPVCAGDTVRMQGSPVLAYGRSAGFGPYTCISERSGMTCRNAQGHGFKIARARQQVF